MAVDEHRGRKDSRHRYVHPYVDGAESPFDAWGGSIKGLRVGDVDGDRKRSDAMRATEFGRCAIEPFTTVRDEHDIVAVSDELFGRRVAYPRAGTCHNRYPGH